MKIEIYPKNKENFKKLIPFAQKIISICKEVGAEPVIYGSFAHFYLTKDKDMNVKDIDLLIPKEAFSRITKRLRKEKIKFDYYPKWGTCIVTHGKLKVELDEVGISGGYKTLNDKSLSKDIFNIVNFYGINVRMITLNQLEEIYIVAYLRSTDSKPKIKAKIENLEKFLKRKVKNNIDIEITENKLFSDKEKSIINQARINEWGKNENKDFNKDYEPNTKWFFVKNKGKIVALGGLRPIKIRYLGKTYNILGICSIISLAKRKGYGKILISFMRSHSHTTGKTILGFTTQTEFFKKAGLGTKNDFIRRFIYKNPKTKEEIIDNEGDGIFYEGKDKFITKVLSTKSKVYLPIPHW